MTKLHFSILLLSISSSLIGCNKTISLTQVNYAHQVESILDLKTDGEVTDVRYGLSFNLTPILETEGLSDTSDYPDVIRLIRDKNGYYYITANQFRHVYVLESDISELTVKRKLRVHETGIQNPALNWRNPVVQLLGSNLEAPVIIDNSKVVKREVSK